MSLLGMAGLGFGTEAAAAPAAPTLSAVDNGNGTVTATIASSTSGSSNVVSYQAVNEGDLGGAAWTSGGTRSGDGTVIVTVAAGYYWLRVVSTLNSQTAVSNFVYIRATDGTDAVMEQLLLAIQSRIQALTLTNIASSSVEILKITRDDEATLPTFPAVTISPIDSEGLNPNGGTNERDDIEYKFLIVIWGEQDETNAHNQTVNRERNLQWRQQIRKALQHWRPTGVSEAYRTVIQPDLIVHPLYWNSSGQWVSGMRAVITSRETRGLT